MKKLKRTVGFLIAPPFELICLAGPIGVYEGPSSINSGFHRATTGNRYVANPRIRANASHLHERRGSGTAKSTIDAVGNTTPSLSDSRS